MPPSETDKLRFKTNLGSNRKELQAVAGRAGAKGGIERKGARLHLGQGKAANRTGKKLGKKMVNGFFGPVGHFKAGVIGLH